MTDEEIIQHCLSRMNGIPQENRNATFRTVVAVAFFTNNEVSIELFDGKILVS